jgi:predicted transcriptional regulator
MHSGKDNKRDRSLQVRVDAECAQRFAALAAALDVSQGDLLRRAVDELLAKAEQQIAPLIEEIERATGSESS